MRNIGRLLLFYRENTRESFHPEAIKHAERADGVLRDLRSRSSSDQMIVAITCEPFHALKETER